MFRVKNDKNIIEIGIVSIEEGNLPSKGDAYIFVNVNSNGFTGKNDLWVDGESLKSFCLGLVELNKNLNGSSTLQSISPGELDLKIYSVSSKGHLAISGTTGYEIHDANDSFWHQVSFGFEFEPTELEKLLKSELVKKVLTSASS